MRSLLLAIILAFAAVPAAGAAQGAEAQAVEYSDGASWLCLPGRDDPCSRPLPTVALDPSGFGSVGQSRPAADPAVDCFYVYPTVSRDPGLNSDMTAGPEEQAVANVQFARFSSVCRTFAPLYRQITLAALPRALAGAPIAAQAELAYGDVRSAWRDYLRSRNQGRPFVLIGHSQGTLHLIRLIAEEIEGSEAGGRMLSAMLIGGNVEVPEGELVGGSFRSTPLCTRAGQTGCIVTFASFRATRPPPPGALFGRATRPGMTVACTNPASLGGGSAPLDSYWFAGASMFGAAPVRWSSEGEPPAPFMRTEGLVSAACVNRGPVGYLSVAVNADPADARTDRIPGDVSLLGRVQPGWGLHLADINLALGDLIRLVEQQRAAWQRRH